MISRRLAIAGLAVLGAVSLATSGCVQATPSPSNAKSATEMLGDAAAKTKDQSFTYTLVYGNNVTGDGAQDGTGTNANANLTLLEPTYGITIKAKVLKIGTDTYLKIDLGSLGAIVPGLAGIGEKWMHLDTSRIGSSSLVGGLTPGGDSMTAEAYIKGIVSAEKVSDTEIKGTIDLSKAAPGPVAIAQLASVSTEGKVVPVTITFDSEGRIVKIVIKMPAVGPIAAADLITTFANYGAPVNLQKPAAGEVVEAPEIIYQFLQ